MTKAKKNLEKVLADTQSEKGRELRENATQLAVSRSVSKMAGETADEARETILDLLDGELDVIVQDEKGQEILTVTNSVRTGSIDWAQFQKDNPAIDFEKYRKPAASIVTVKVGSVITAEVEAIVAKSK
ncbi:hypothetical protein PP301_gp043 [Gordonia phage GMA2]|uniref:Uncharacterized protein n=1 Tax=Gordonia phage GMA2 TaxID=1647283 RepID=A0A0K0N7E4_9CAUD|nr:hypothetical protein PP301_gp043 [Gordonia phage GMA2]AKJ72581.1 hypothetical protein GMA2_43 [Gordonia phage GMA2]